jgi:acetyl-CoA decarbonylase/synthase complex subunit gamma
MSDSDQEKCCCCSSSSSSTQENVDGKCNSDARHHSVPLVKISWIIGEIDTSIGKVPQIGCNLGFADFLGACRMRLGIGRMRYRIPPGLYAVGHPSENSPVLVTANYKLTLDSLRSELCELDAWILVLDTHGVNVWCAAGKGTFGTDELVKQIVETKLCEVVRHRQLILPQLGAPGVAAHQVKNRCDFEVIYGPVRANDISEFINAGNQATPKMRKVEFPLRQRLAVTPVDLPRYGKYFLPIALFMFFLAGLGIDGYSWTRTMQTGSFSASLLIATWLASTVFAPVFLPWLPGRPLSLKGLWLGICVLILFMGGLYRIHGPFDSWLGMISWFMLIPSASSFLTMAFTGSTTYTSLSGVRYEMRRAVPLQLAAAIIGLFVWLAGRFV